MTTHRGKYPTDQHGWAELLPERKPKPSFNGKKRAAWVVVGAGVTGLACARRLAQLHNGREIILVEARQVGQGASGRNSGFAVAVSKFSGNNDADRRKFYCRINRINRAGLDILRNQIFEYKIDCQWNETGFYHVAADKLALQNHDHFLRYLDALQINHDRLERRDIYQQLGTSHYQKGVHVPFGALLQPAALVCGLADNLPPNVTLYEQSPVLEIAEGSPVVLRFASGEISTDNVVLATNYEIAKLGFYNRYLIGSTLSGSFTRVLTRDELASLGCLNQWGVLSLHPGGATVRLTIDGRLCVRNTVEYHGGNLLSEQQLAHRQSIHRAAFDKRFPQLKQVPFEFSWSGVEGISRNETNIFGRARNNIYFAGGYNGSGVTRGTAFGTALADYASGAKSKLIDDCLASLPPTWIPPRPILDIGVRFSLNSRLRGTGLDR